VPKKPALAAGFFAMGSISGNKINSGLTATLKIPDIPAASAADFHGERKKIKPRTA
jgi:hypothetical protein